MALRGTGPVQLARSGSPAADALSIVTNPGNYLISLSALRFGLLGIQTYRNERPTAGRSDRPGGGRPLQLPG